MCDLTNYKVIKHNKMVQAKSDFSALEHKIILLAMVQIKPTDEAFKMYRIPIRDILGEGNKTEYSLVRKSVIKLHKSTLEVEEGNKWTTYSFIIKAEGKTGRGYLEVQFHEDVQHLLLGLKSRYTTYTLSNVINFKKNYSLRIYELCKQVQKIGKRELSIDYLKTLFSLEGKYKGYHFFKKRVIESAIEEINKHSDLFLQYEEMKEGRKVEKIRFLVYQNKAITDASQLKTLTDIYLAQGLKDRLLKTGFKCHEIEQITDKYTQGRIMSVLAHFEAHIEDIKHPKAWIEKTLQEYVDKADYTAMMQEELQEHQEEEKKQRLISAQTLAIQNLEKKIAQDKKDVDEYQQTGQLRPGDIAIRFKGKTVNESIEELEERIFDLEYDLKKSQRELNKMLKSP